MDDGEDRRCGRWEAPRADGRFWARSDVDPSEPKHRWRAPERGIGTYRSLCGLEVALPCRYGPWPASPGPFCARCEDLFFRAAGAGPVDKTLEI